MSEELTLSDEWRFSLTFSSSNKVIFTITPDGHMEFAEGCTPNDAALAVRDIFNAASRTPDASAVELVRELVEASVDIRLLNDAVTLITKSLAAMLTDPSFASPHIEDHRPRVPRWVMEHFRHDYTRRIQYVNDIKQRLDWIRNATEKARKSVAVTKATEWLKTQEQHHE